VIRIWHPVRIVWAFVSVGLLNLLQYRTDFFVALGNAAINLATQLLALSVIYSQTTDLQGWSRDELLVLVGIHFFISGLIGLVIRPSMEALMEGIRLGTFDFMLTKPADAQLLASAQVIAPQAVTDVVVGLGVLAYGIDRLDARVSVVTLGAFLGMLLAGLVIIYSFMLILSSCAFWFVKLHNVLVIFQTLFGNAGRWPVTIFPGWLRAVLTFVVPLAFAVTVPAQALTGRLGLPTALLAVALAVGFFAGARAFWLFALRRYTGASA